MIVGILRKIRIALLQRSYLAVEQEAWCTNPGNRVLVIKLDALGDYILFRNHLNEYISFMNRSGFEVDLLANSRHNDLIRAFDLKNLGQLYSATREELHLSFIHRKRVINQLNRKNYHTVVNWTYSRVTFDDLLVRSIAAKNKIGFEGDLNNQSAREKRKMNRYYSQLVKSERNIKFEYLRNFEMLKQLSPDSETPKFELNCGPDVGTSTQKEQYLVVCPGASSPLRRWGSDHFIDLINKITDEFEQMNILICGSSAEKPLGLEITASVLNPSRITDHTGKLNLEELCGILKNASVVICCETGVTHLSAAIGVKYLCVSNGNHFGRFHPYPTNISDNGEYFYPPEVNRIWDKSGFEEVVKKYGSNSRLAASSIVPDQIFSKLREVLDS